MMSSRLRCDRLESVSVFLPVTDETESLINTVEIILADCPEAIREFLIVVCGRTTQASRDTAAQLQARHPDTVKVIEQKRPFLGGAAQDAFEAAAGSHFLMMASDMETPPDRVKEFVAMGRKHPSAIITGSRWIKGGGFKGYSRIKYFLNFVFQKTFSLMYWTRLSDMTYGYRLIPMRLIQSIRWEELRHPLLFETICKPLKLGVEVVEIPTMWEARAEGASSNTFMRNFEYFRVGIKTLFSRRNRILKPEALAAPEDK